MSQKQRPRPISHDYEIGELVALTAEVSGIDARRICQVIGFRKTKLRLLPLAGVPVVAEPEQVRRCGLPAGSSRPPQRKWRRRRQGGRRSATQPQAA